MIPGYLLIKNMHLIDNRWSLILPGLISAYNVIIMRSFFSTIPESLEESARLDGANDVTIFAKIVLPLSKASIATIALFTAVGYWNDYFSSVLYINTKSRWSLQAVLRYMLTNTNQAVCRCYRNSNDQRNGSYDQSSIRCRCNRTDSVRISFRAEVLCKRSYDRRR